MQAALLPGLFLAIVRTKSIQMLRLANLISSVLIVLLLLRALLA